MDETEVSIIIPAYNEGQAIGALVRKIKELYPHVEVLVIDDGSTDDTAAMARDAGASVYSHPHNIGNGAAIKSGIRLASGEVLVFIDGDGQHDPRDVERLLKGFPEYDMVVGARAKGNQASWGRAFANRIYNWLASYVAKFQVQDLTSGFRAVKFDIAREYLHLLPNTYSYPTTLTLCVLRSGRSLRYVPIETENRKKGKSKIRILPDGIRFFLIITRICTLYSPFRIFLPVSFAMFCLGLGYYLYTFFSQGRFTNMSLLLFTTSVLVFMMGLISEQISQMRFEKSEGDRFIQ
ncbi:MAG: glycosyltransferase family 2 protein [Thermodesulfobacteriota bacterium]|nr:glycosyltransferase family 2 protein [Thermodesulfobacteriota bacterium]